MKLFESYGDREEKRDWEMRCSLWEAGLKSLKKRKRLEMISLFCYGMFFFVGFIFNYVVYILGFEEYFDKIMKISLFFLLASFILMSITPRIKELELFDHDWDSLPEIVEIFVVPLVFVFAIFFLACICPFIVAFDIFKTKKEIEEMEERLEEGKENLESFTQIVEEEDKTDDFWN